MNRLGVHLVNSAFSSKTSKATVVDAAKKKQDEEAKKVDYSSRKETALKDLLEPSKHTVFPDSRLYSAVYTYIEKTPEVAAVVDKLKDSLRKSVLKCEGELNEELKTYCEPSQDIHERYNQALIDVSQLGFHVRPISNDGSDYDSFWYVKPSTTQPHPTYHTTPKHVLFDGVEITPEHLSSGTNPFDQTLREYIKAHPNYMQDYEQLMADVAALEKRKFMLAVSSSKKEELARLKQRAADVKAIYDKVGSYAQSSARFNALLPNQIEKIKQLHDIQSEFAAITNLILNNRSKALQIKGYGRPTDIADLVEQCTTEAYENLTPEDRAAYEALPYKIATTLLDMDDKDFPSLANRHHSYSEDFSHYTYAHHDMTTKAVEVLKEQYQERLKNSQAESGSQIEK